MFDSRHNDREAEARRTAALLEALAREAERIGRRQDDPTLRRALLGQVARSRADANQLRERIGRRWPEDTGR
jgi:hypothetical protein